MRFFPRARDVRIVTTNFEHLFEDAAASIFTDSIEVFRAPALPLGEKFSGIVHVHGSLDVPRDLVLTDSDFGRAYLTQGWARRFLVQLFQRYTVLFVGYSHGDVVMHYLARALPETETGKRFSLVSEDSNIEDWIMRGIDRSCFRNGSQETSAF